MVHWHVPWRVNQGHLSITLVTAARRLNWRFIEPLMMWQKNKGLKRLLGHLFSFHSNNSHRKSRKWTLLSVEHSLFPSKLITLFGRVVKVFYHLVNVNLIYTWKFRDLTGPLLKCNHKCLASARIPYAQH